jgi:hypothetical protein
VSADFGRIANVTRNIEGRLTKLEAATSSQAAVCMFLQVQHHKGETEEELEKRIQRDIRQQAQRAGGEPGVVFVWITGNKP